MPRSTAFFERIEGRNKIAGKLNITNFGIYKKNCCRYITVHFSQKFYEEGDQGWNTLGR